MKILIVGVLLIILSLLFHKRYNTYIGFLFVLLIMGFQSGVGGDYYNYLDNFKEFQMGWKSDFHSSEIGWEILNQMFVKTSFPFFVFCISLIQYFILSKFVHKYITRSYQYIAVILFFITFSFMLLQMKAIRQGLAVELCVAAFMYMDNKKILKSTILVIIAFTIHNSVIVIIPFIYLFYYLGKRNIFNAKINSINELTIPVLLTLVYFIVFLFKSTILNDYLISLAQNAEILRFSKYFEDVEFQFEISWLIVVYNAFIVFVVSWFFKYASPTLRFFSILSIIAAFFDMLFFGLGSLPRSFLYFSIFNIVIYPNVAEFIKQRFNSLISFVFVTVCIAYAFKTSLPWLLENVDNSFVTFEFIFLQ